MVLRRGTQPHHGQTMTPKRKNMTTEQITPARAGRERTCTHCGATYRSPRTSSLYCSTSCRQKANRGTAPTGGPKVTDGNLSPITKALLRVGYVGCISPASNRSKEAPVYALLVSREHAHTELAHQFSRKGWGVISREEFVEALRKDGIKSYQSRSEEAEDQKLWQDRQRQRLKRSS
jgi:hypothetical protein